MLLKARVDEWPIRFFFLFSFFLGGEGGEPRLIPLVSPLAYPLNHTLILSC